MDTYALGLLSQGSRKQQYSFDKHSSVLGLELFLRGRAVTMFYPISSMLVSANGGCIPHVVQDVLPEHL